MGQPATPSVDGRDDASTKPDRVYRHALSSFATGVTVVTCALDDGKRVGLTVNSFASVSLEPPLVSWCLARTTICFEAFAIASHFAVNVLAADQEALVHRFARRSLDSFGELPSTPGLGATPLLAGTAARFECRRVAEYSAGDHIILLGQVERYARFEREPLVLVRGRYGRLGDG